MSKKLETKCAACGHDNHHLGFGVCVRDVIVCAKCRALFMVTSAIETMEGPVFETVHLERRKHRRVNRMPI
jgi:hypothetical protein